MIGVRKILKFLFVLTLCVGLSVESENSTETVEEKTTKSGGGKPRKKRKGCKCVQRYMTEVDRLIAGRLKEFNDSYVQRMSESMLHLSEGMAEIKNTMSAVTKNVQSVMQELSSTQKDSAKLTRQLSRVSGAVANLTKYVDTMQSRLVVRSIDMTANDVATEPETSTSAKPMPTQCHDVFEQGGMRFMGDYYIMIKPAGAVHAFKALCQMVNNSGWTVIQKRQDGSVDFFRTWDEYRRGFGNLEGEFWLGNDNIHYLTTQEDMMVRIDMEDWSGKRYYAVYNYFRVDGPQHNYRLHISGYHGNAGDAMTSPWETHDNMPFSTKDRDNDGRFYDSCAEHYKGGWWFNNCFEAHLNGKYYHKGSHMEYFQRDGIQWNPIHMYSSLKAVQMMVKPVENPRSTASNELSSHI